jgi:hypothetical protein
MDQTLSSAAKCMVAKMVKKIQRDIISPPFAHLYIILNRFFPNHF